MTYAAIGALPADWRAVLGPFASRESLSTLDAAVYADRSAGVDVYPSAGNVFAALRLTPYRTVKALLVGQDPYHGPGQANGLAFSVADGVKLPPSLRNIFRELESDLGLPSPTSGSLEPWARHGVLLLNTILTVVKGTPRSHANLGWQRLTGAIIQAVQDMERPVAFLLWGAFARKAAGPIPEPHFAVDSAHPSPRSARRGFLGSRPFSRANEFLSSRGVPEIDWRLE